MHTTLSFKATALAALVSITLPAAFAAGPASSGWKWDATLYGLAAGMSGDVTVKGVKVDVDVPFSTIMENLEFGAMGNLRVSNGRWAFAADVAYLGLGGGKNGSSVDFDQWNIEPTAGYRVSEAVEFVLGARYISLEATATVPLPARPPLVGKDKQDWWDPIVGVNLTLPFNATTRLDLRADIGGGHDGDLTWQAFPRVTWRFNPTGSLHAGYRWLYADYRNTDGCECGEHYFRYDVLTQGPQIGVTFRF
jgi:hypothetical protein